MSELLEAALMPTDTPKTDALIHRVMRQYPGVSASAQAKYYEEVHQEIAPLCRRLEREVAALKADLRDYMNAANAEARFADELKTERDQLRAELAALRAPVEQAPEGLLDRVMSARQRIIDGHAPRRIPADPTDVDLVLTEVAMFLRGEESPFWIAAPSAPGREE